MSAQRGGGWNLSLVGERADRVTADLLLAPCFEDERPPRGAAGLVDWRHCGLLSREILGGFAAGQPGSALLLPSEGRLRSARALVFGLGPRRGFTAERLAEALGDALRRAAALRSDRVALALPPEAQSGLAAATTSRVALAAVAEAAAGDASPRQLLLVFAPEELPVARSVLAELDRAGLPARPARLGAPRVEAPRPPGPRPPGGP